MAWTAPMTAVANSTFTAAQFNTHVRDNLNETAPAKATTAGSILAVSGANAIVERTPDSDSVLTSETTTSTSYTDLTTPGPSLTISTGPKAFVAMSALVSNSTGGAQAFMAVEVSGASSFSASDNFSIRYESSNANDLVQCSYASMYSDSLTSGSNVFTCKYKVSSGTGTFINRRLVVIPF